MAEHAGHVTTWPMSHLVGHVSATFVATFRSRSWPRSNMIFEVFSRVFKEVFKFGRMRLVYGFGTL